MYFTNGSYYINMQIYLKKNYWLIGVNATNLIKILK
jgi:hypothetical protein